MRTLFALALLTLTACTAQQITLNGRDSDGADCVLTNDKGTWRATMPATLTVSPSRADLTIDCRKPGWTYHTVLHAPYGGQNFTQRMTRDAGAAQ